MENSFNAPSESQALSIFWHSTQNYTVIFNESYSSTLYINISYESNRFRPHLLAWRHNGHLINSTRNPRIIIQDSGSLIIDAVEPSDAGNYKLTVLISNRLGCQSVQYKVFVERELL